MEFRRRNFVKLLAVSSLFSIEKLLSSCSIENSNKNSDLILGGGKYIDYDNFGKTKYVLGLCNLNHSTKTQIETNFFPHGAAIHPDSPDTLLLFQKKGPGSCEIDLKRKKVNRYLTPASNCNFYGHGAYSKNGALLFVVESYLQNQDGLISVRDANSLEILGEFPTYGKNPHDCHLFDNGKLLAITNGGGMLRSKDMPCVSYVEINSGRLVEKILLPDKYINAGHLVISSNKDLGVISAPREGLPKSGDGGVSFRRIGDKIKSLKILKNINQNLTGETLSAVIHEKSNTFATTTPDANLVCFWDINNFNLKKYINLPKPRGITTTLDKKYFIVSYGQQANLIKIKTDTLEVEEQSNIKNTFITGSHIINLGLEVKTI